MNFENGQTVYLKNGEVAVYVQALVDGRHVVQELIEWEHPDDGIMQDLAEAAIVQDVFLAPPTSVQDKTIARLNEQINERRRVLRELDEKLATSQEEMKSRKMELELHDALRNFELFTKGLITHIVVDHGDTCLPTILPWPEACTMQEWGRRQNTNLRLITVSGDCKNGTVSLKLNQYSDGSGHVEHPCFLCTSEEEANERYAEGVKAYFERAKKIQGMPYNFESSKLELEAKGIEIPTWLLRKFWISERAEATAHLNDALEKRDKQAARLEAAMKALEDPSFDTDIPE